MMDAHRRYTIFDKLCLCIDQTIRVLSHQPKTSGAPNPAEKVAETKLSAPDNKHAAGIMRINHAGEICAQALYHGQQLFSRSFNIQQKLQQAAIQEGDHLSWCKQRLDELNSHPSYLMPLWYSGSFCIGMFAGLLGDEWSLGFLAETEKQVVIHLSQQMSLLPQDDHRSFAILKQMAADEALHQEDATELGAAELPIIIQKMMHYAAKVMVKISYWW